MKGELSQLCQFCRKSVEGERNTKWKLLWAPNDKIICSCVIKSLMLLLLQFPGCIWVRLSDTPISHSIRN